MNHSYYYRGFRDPEGKPHILWSIDGSEIPPRNDLYNHSPDGFEWGYGGSGPAQAALAILAHALTHLPELVGKLEHPDQMAVELHEKFKRVIIAALPMDEEWIISDDQIRAFLRLSFNADRLEEVQQ